MKHRKSKWHDDYCASSNKTIFSAVLLTVVAIAAALFTLPAQAQKPGDKLTLTVNDVEFVFCYIPAGTFMMGSPENEAGREDNEKLHKVVISKPFYMMETPITQKQLTAAAKDTPYASFAKRCAFKGDDNPVEYQQFMPSQAEAICKKLAEATGKKFRLPTEAEWEYACRAGTTTPFHYGEDLDGTMANFNSYKPYGKGERGKMRNKTTEVKQFKPNAWGLYDMHGNVAELCVDYALPNTDLYTDGVVDPGVATPEFIETIQRDDPKKVLPSRQIVRGGAYNVGAAECRSASKSIDYAPNLQADYFGYRLVLIP